MPRERKAEMDQVEQRRAEWLAAVKAITNECFERESRLADLCPQRYPQADKENGTAPSGAPLPALPT